MNGEQFNAGLYFIGLILGAFLALTGEFIIDMANRKRKRNGRKSRNREVSTDYFTYKTQKVLNMKVIRIHSDGRYTSHGIGYTEHDGYAGTIDNRMSIKTAITYELNRCIKIGEHYQIEVNGKNDGHIFKKGVES
jgi:hypothetical protein